MNRKIYLTVLFAIVYIFSFAQIDFSKKVLNVTKEDSVKLINLNKISEQLLAKKEFVQAKKSAYESIVLANRLSNKIILTNSYFILSKIFYQEDKWDSAFYYAIESLKVKESFFEYDKKELITSLKYISSLCRTAGKWKMSIEFDLRLLDICDSLNDNLELAKTCTSLAASYNQIGNHDISVKYFKESIDLYELIRDYNGKGNALIGLGYVYALSNNHLAAIDYYEEAIKIYEELKDTTMLININSNIVWSYKMTKQFKKALDVSLKSLSLRRKTGKTLYWSGVANSYSDLGEHSKAIDCYKKDLNTFKEQKNFNYLTNVYFDLADEYSKISNYKLAYKYFKLATFVKDSITKIRNTNQIVDLEKKYQNERKQLEIDKLSSLNKLKEVELQRKEGELKHQTKQKILFASGFILLLLFAIFIVRSYRQKQIANLLISEKTKEITDSINYASRLQKAILPPTEVLKNQFSESFIIYKPKDIVAGDFYWMEMVDNIIFIAVADCTGHGVPGAMVSIVCSNALNRSIIEFGLRDTSKILDNTTDLVIGTFEKSNSEINDGMDISLIAYNKISKKIHWSGANNSLLYTRNGNIIEIKADKQPIGRHDHRVPFTTHSIDYSENLIFYLFSDGLSDQFGGPRGKKFMHKQLKSSIEDINKLPLMEQQIILEKKFQDWKGNLEQVDDITVLGIKI